MNDRDRDLSGDGGWTNFTMPSVKELEKSTNVCSHIGLRWMGANITRGANFGNGVITSQLQDGLNPNYRASTHEQLFPSGCFAFHATDSNMPPEPDVDLDLARMSMSKASVDPNGFIPQFGSTYNENDRDEKFHIVATDLDVCFAWIRHPGTVAWRDEVDSHDESVWSPDVYQDVKRKMEEQGRRFLVHVPLKNSGGKKSKKVKDCMWQLATDKQAESKTKQRFTDGRRKPEVNGSKKRKIETSNKIECYSRPQTTLPVETANEAQVDAREALIKAIKQCQQEIENAVTSHDPNIIERKHAAEQNLKLMLPMNKLDWSYDLSIKLLERQTCTEEYVSILLDMKAENSRQTNYIKRLKKAEIHFVNFIRCLMDIESNPLDSTVLDDIDDSGNRRAGGGADDDNNGDDDDEEEDDEEGDDDEGDDDDDDGRQGRNNTICQKMHHCDDAWEAGRLDNNCCDLLTVFQASPLAFTLTSGETRLLPPLDLDFEKMALLDALRDAKNVGSSVEVAFEVATTDRLVAFLARGESHVMHISCHGHPDYLALDNGWGGMQVTRIQELKQIISSGNGNLKLVFLSSCCSQQAGEAFISAGVPHVICCHDEHRPQDKAAIEFERSFYRALACGNTLKASFNLAWQTVQVSFQESRHMVNKFVLLPAMPDDETYHDVPIFLRTPPGLTGTNGVVLRPFPYFPTNVKMNALDVYQVLAMLAEADVVKITGAAGGRRLAAAVASYIRGRSHTMNLEKVSWFPPVVSDHASKYFQLVCDVVLEDSDLPIADLMGESSKYHSCFKEAISNFVGRHCLFVINAKRFKSRVQSLRLDRLVCDILNNLHVKILLVCGEAQDCCNHILRHRKQVGVFTLSRVNADKLKPSQSHPDGSENGAVSDDESPSEISEASVPAEIDVYTVSELPLQSIESVHDISKCVKGTQVVSTTQIESMMANATLRSKVGNKGKNRKPINTTATIRRLKDHHKGDSSTSVSSESSDDEVPSLLPNIRTSDDFNAALSKVCTIGAGARSEVSPFLNGALANDSGWTRRVKSVYTEWKLFRLFSRTHRENFHFHQAQHQK